MNFILTDHADVRISARNITLTEIEECLKYGKKYYKTGICFHIILKNIIEKYQLPDKLNGLCVLVKDSVVITAYKNKSASKNIKKLSKRKSKGEN